MAKKELSQIRIEPAENGGHTVTHHYREARREGKHGLVSSYIEPESHVFGADEGHKMLAHVANHLNITEPSEPDEPAEDEGEDEDVPAKGRISKATAERIRESAR